MVNVGGNQCDCASGTVWDATKKKCIVQGACEEDYLKWNDSTNSCVCKTSAELLSMDRYYFGICEVYDSTKISDGCKRIRDNWDISTGTCVCPAPFTQQGVNCVCQSPRTMVNGECVCDFDLTKPTLEEDEIFNGTMPNCKETCDTANYYFPSSTKEECVQNLPDCECLKEISMNDYQCYCKSNATNADLVNCGVLEDYYYTGTGSCTASCPEPKIRDINNISSCVCTATKPPALKLMEFEKWDPTDDNCRTCDTTNSNRVYEFQNRGNCICKPASEITFNGEEIYDTTKANCKFDCASIGKVADAAGTTCVDPAPVCGCLEVLVNNVCVCNENITTDELRYCADLKKDEGYIFDATAPSCQSKCKGTSRPATSLKGCACDCLKVYNGNECVCDPTQANNDKCISDEEVYDDTVPLCKTCKEPNREYDVTGACVCKPASEIKFAANEIYDPTAQNCKYTCKDGAVADANNAQCIGGCLEQYNYTTEKLECIPNPSDEITKKCITGNYISDPSKAECKVECSTLTTANDVHKQCLCDEAKVAVALNQQGNLNKIYALDDAPACMMACQGQTIPSADRRQCRPVDCLYETTDNITQHCIQNPSATLAKQCLANTNYVADPSKATCKRECTGLTAPDNNHLACPCDYNKVSDALQLPSNLNKIYDLDNAPACMATCVNQTIPSRDRLVCDEVPCLYETTDNVTMHCIANPTDAQTQACLAGENNISNPTAQNCRQDCGDRRSPNTVHKVCECDVNKMAGKYSSDNMKFDVASATCESVCPANQIRDPQNPTRCICSGKEGITFAENEIYYPTSLTCKYVCKDGAVANVAHTQCIGKCLQEYNYETEKLQCIEDPSDEITTKCLLNQNKEFDGNEPECSKDCPAYTSPNAVHKDCLCDINKKDGHYSSNNVKYDPTKVDSGCESPCPSSFTVRSSSNPYVCVCPATKPSAVTIQTGYYYDATSSVLTGATACQSTCPTDATQIAAWVNAHQSSFTNNKVKYDSTKAGCLSSCTGNYIASLDKTSCVCGISASSCGAGTYYDAASCSCKVCPAGSYCVGGKTAPEKCPCGTYGATDGLKTSSCTGLCQVGHYCPEGSVSANKLACQDGQLCPAGTCQPGTCSVPLTSVAPYEACDKCMSKAKLISLNYLGANDIYKNDTSVNCKQNCGDRKSPNSEKDTCVCDMTKMATKYSSNNMKFDATKANCESACPTSFSIRSSSNPQVCVCPATKPSAVTIQAGYYYSPYSTTLTGTTACQASCPTVYAAIKDWVGSHSASFSNNKVVYDSTKAGCLSSCTGNYVASADKTSCVCGISASSCGAGTYYDAASCSCKVCPAGSYCVGGKTAPEKCPCGTYGATQGLKTAACSGVCQAGYYCPAGSTKANQVVCGAGYTCQAGACGPQACSFPYTSTSPYTSCNTCRTEAEIRQTSPNYIGSNEVYVNNISKGCKQCKSNMVYNSSGACVCPSDKPYWNGSSCQTCQVWGTLYFARQEKDNPSCTLYNHLMGTRDGKCFTDYTRVPSDGMKQAANLLSSSDKNRTFGNGIYAYMVAVSPDGKSASVVGVFTSKTWYNIFPGDISSVSTSRQANLNAASSCANMCGGNAECVNTCNYFYGNISNNTMFSTCVYAVSNGNGKLGQTLGGGFDEHCKGGKITMSNSCAYSVGGLMRRVTSPLVLDLKGDGLEYTSAGEGVMFDLDFDGSAEQTAWTTVQTEFDNAFLVLDKNNNGQVDNGGELFGDQNGAENGFVELAKYDDNGDDLINKEDDVYVKLLLWVDFNKNGKVDYDNNNNTLELKTLEEAGVTELSTLYKKETDSQGNILRDIYGNITGFIGSFKMMIEDAAGKLIEVVRTMMDVFFVAQ